MSATQRGRAVPGARAAADAEPTAEPGPEPKPEPAAASADGSAAHGVDGSAAPAGGGSAGGGDRGSGRDRLRAAVVPRATRAQLLSGLLCLLLGLAVAVQVRQHTGGDLSALRQAELVGLLDDASDRNDRLQREISDLERTREQLRSSGDQRQAARQLAQQRLDTLGVLAGTVAATGPGIRMSITLPSGTPGGGDSAYLLLLDAVQELRDAGAEAIQVGDVRVVAETSFVATADGGVEVDRRRLRSPYAFTAIGDAQTLASAMDFPDGVVSRVRSAGGQSTVTPAGTVEVTALRAPSSAAYARPVPPPDPTPDPPSPRRG